MLSSNAAAIAAESPPRDVWKLALLALLLLLLLAFGAWLIKPFLPVLMGLEEFGRQAAAAPPVAVGSEQAGQRSRETALAKARDVGTRLTNEFVAMGGDLARKQSTCAPGAIGAVVGPSGEIVAGDGRVVGHIVSGEDGKAAVADADGKPILGADGKPADARAVAEQAAKEKAMPGKSAPATDKATPGKPPTAPQGAEAARRETPPPPQRTPQSPSPDKATAPKMEKPLTVPPDARAKGDVGFMQGVWRSRSTLTTQRGEEDIRVNYQFDDKGKGKSVIVQQNGVTCEAPATARFDKDGKLVIEEQANPQCSDGTGYVKSTVTCDVAKEGGADCAGRNDSGKTYSVQIGK